MKPLFIAIILWIGLLAEISHAQFGGGKVVDDVRKEVASVPIRLLPGTPVFSDRAIEDYFDTPCDWDGRATTIRDFAGRLAATLKDVPVILREDKLNEESISLEEPIIVPGMRLSLYDLCVVALGPLQLSVARINGTVEVTTKTDADCHLIHRVYKIDPALLGSDEAAPRTILSLLEMTSGQWYDVDGEGGQAGWLPDGKGLEIRQTWAVHREIRGLLNAMNRAAAAPPVDWYGADPPNALDLPIPGHLPLATMPRQPNAGSNHPSLMPMLYEAGR